MPEYKGIDPEIAPFSKEWLELAQIEGLRFKNNITIGFKNINEPEVVGMCRYEMGFREIDIDKRYWNSSSELTKKSLVRHEMSHCYCGREHDYAENKEYYGNERDKKEGFFEDGCPISILYPYVVSDTCMSHHYQEYSKEMFYRCTPY